MQTLALLCPIRRDSEPDAAPAEPLAAAPSEPLAPARPLAPEDELCLARRKRVVMSYIDTPGGGRELRIYYGLKEISFDEPELFPFGEALAAQDRFVARAAATWGPGYAWDTVRPLLEELLAEGVLERPARERPARREGSAPSPIPPRNDARPRTWLECEALTAELSGRAVELGYLELIVPVYRILHPVLDSEQRQVGEANVFPAAMLLDVPTEWRPCQYPGSRYQDEFPMNVTALRTMIKHWRPMMAVLHGIRGAYLERFPEARGGLSLGHVETLSTLALVLPTYLALRATDPIANGALSPVLSSVFRVTDGLRLTVHQMLLEGRDGLGRRDPDAPARSSDVFDYAERTAGFLSARGVCAGPRHMIAELLDVVIEGKQVTAGGPAPLDAPVAAALEALPEAFEYGLRALQAFGVTISYWSELTRRYQRLQALMAGAPGALPGPLEALRQRLEQRAGELLRSTAFAHDDARQAHARLYGDAYRRAASLLGDEVTSLSSRLSPQHIEGDGAALDALHAALRGPGPAAPAWLSALGAELFDYFRMERAVLTAAAALQAQINTRLGRRAPERPLDTADLNVYPWLFEPAWPFPDLRRDLRECLGIDVRVARARIQVGDPDPSQPTGEEPGRHDADPDGTRLRAQSGRTAT